MEKSKPWIAIIGQRASGKTTAGLELAKSLQYEFLDLDSQIEFEENRKIPEIFATNGESYFRQIELNTLFKIPKTPLVLSTGGGLPMNKEAVKYLKQFAHVVFLNVSKDILYQRRSANDNNRPLLAGAKTLEEEMDLLFETRQKLYESVATHIVSNQGGISDTVALTRSTLGL
jgi:shikimate kinase